MTLNQWLQLFKNIDTQDVAAYVIIRKDSVYAFSTLKTLWVLGMF